MSKDRLRRLKAGCLGRCCFCYLSCECEVHVWKCVEMCTFKRRVGVCVQGGCIRAVGSSLSSGKYLFIEKNPLFLFLSCLHPLSS